MEELYWSKWSNFTVELYQSSTGQNVEFWSKYSNFCGRVVLVKQLMKRLKSEQNGQSYAVELYWLSTC